MQIKSKISGKSEKISYNITITTNTKRDTSIIKTTDTSRELAIKLARLADRKKGEDIIVLNISRLTFIADYFVIVSGRNKKQNQAIALELMDKFKSLGVTPLSVQGYEEGSWVLIDFGSVVFHIMHNSLRDFYNIENIWADAPRIRWKK